MDEGEFEGTLVLEKLVEIEKLDDFWEAIDSDDFIAAKNLMEIAKIDPKVISIVLEKMKEANGDH